MDQSRPMQVGQTVQKLICDVFPLDWLQSLVAFLQCVCQIGLHALEDGIDVLAMRDGRG